MRRLLASITPLTPITIEAYFLELYKSGKKATYLNHMLDALSLYGKYKQLEGLNIKRFKEEEHQKAVLSDQEIEAFLALPPNTKGEKRQENWNKWTLFWSILAYSGMRTHEVAQLTINDVDFGRGVFSLGITKTSPRLVPISPLLIPTLHAHIASITQAYLFCSPYGKPFNMSSWDYDFKTRIKRLGIKRTNLTPYSLRHSFITRMLDEDISLKKVQMIVGHKRIETTAHYYHLTTKQLIATLNKDPMARKAIDPKIILNALIEQIKQFGLDTDDRFTVSLSQKTTELSLKVKIKTQHR